MKKKQVTQRTSQQGISLIESLVSLVVLAVGVLGLIGFQLQTLRDSRDSVGRARAVVAIQDIAERIRVNPFAAAAYNVNFAPAPAAAIDCTANPCTVGQLAAWDLVRWKANVAMALPGGMAAIAVSPTDARQYAVMICWRENRGDDAAASGIIKNTTVSGNVGAAMDCNAVGGAVTGHLSYVQPFR